MESHMIIIICNKESLQEERAWKEHAGKGNIRQKGATVAGGVSQTGANTPTRGVHDRHKGDSRTVRTALAQGRDSHTTESLTPNPGGGGGGRPGTTPSRTAPSAPSSRTSLRSSTRLLTSV